MPIEKLGIRLYNLKEAAEVLGVSYATMKNYSQGGRINGQRVGRNIMIAEEELQRFLRGGAATVKAESQEVIP